MRAGNRNTKREKEVKKVCEHLPLLLFEYSLVASPPGLQQRLYSECVVRNVLSVLFVNEKKREERSVENDHHQEEMREFFSFYPLLWSV